MFRDIDSIRILPNNKATFPTEQDFRFFIENTLEKRGGRYYFPNNMMKGNGKTLVLFQYDAMIRAVGVVTDAKKEPFTDEDGSEYAGYYRFDMDTIHYLDEPIDKEEFSKIYPAFTGFNQSKQIIPLEYLDILKQFVLIGEIEEEIKHLPQGMTRDAVVKIRVNQGVFREKLLSRFGKCCLCGVSDLRMLIASHIKPWKTATPTEKLDIDNGFLFCPNHDKVFDQGFITFSDEGKICISNELSAVERLFMNIQENSELHLTDGNKKYLKYHRKHIFRH